MRSCVGVDWPAWDLPAGSCGEALGESVLCAGRLRRVAVRVLLVAVALLAVLVLGTTIGVRAAVGRALSRALGVPVSVGLGFYDPFARTLLLTGVSVGGGRGGEGDDAEVVRFGRVELALGELRLEELMSGSATPEILSLRVVEPSITIVRSPEGVSVPGLARLGGTPVPAREGAAGPRPFRIARVTVERGRVQFVDRTLEEGEFVLEVTGVEGTLENLHRPQTAGTAPTTLSARGALAGGTAQVSLSGTPLASPSSVSFKASVDNIDMTLFKPYLRGLLALDVREGRLSLTSEGTVQGGVLASRNVATMRGLVLALPPEGLASPVGLLRGGATALILKGSGEEVTVSFPLEGDLGALRTRPGLVMAVAVTKAVQNQLVTAPGRVADIPGALFDLFRTVGEVGIRAGEFLIDTSGKVLPLPKPEGSGP